MTPRNLAVTLACALAAGGARAASNPQAIVFRFPCTLAGVQGTTDYLRCGPAGSKGDDDDDGLAPGWNDGRLDFVSGGAVLASETAPFFYSRSDRAAYFYADGNNSAVLFHALYADAATSVLLAHDLVLRLVVLRSKKWAQIGAQRYMPVAGALWSQHSEDSFLLQAELDAEVAAREGAITTEQLARAAAVQDARDYADTQVAAERTRAEAAEAAGGGGASITSIDALDGASCNGGAGFFHIAYSGATVQFQCTACGSPIAACNTGDQSTQACPGGGTGQAACNAACTGFDPPVCIQPSCAAILGADSSSPDGPYLIKPPGFDPLQVWCDMLGGGWTLVLRGNNSNWTGWDTAGALNLADLANLGASDSSKAPDAVVNALLTVALRVDSCETRYVKPTCVFGQMTPVQSGSGCLTTYSDLSWNGPRAGQGGIAEHMGIVDWPAGNLVTHDRNNRDGWNDCGPQEGHTMYIYVK